jgi:arylsulfatase A-like enzyme
MSRNGSFENFSGDSSEIIVNEALEFITQKSRSNIPFFVVIWYGTPHSPWMTLDKDKIPFENLNEQSMNHYGELVAMDRSIGTLRAGLKKLNINQETLVWFTSDNGGLPRINPSTTGGLRDFKGSLYEGGIRVPAIIELPKMIKPRVTNYTASAADIFPTIADVCDLPDNSMLTPQDGISLTPLFKKELINRKRPIVFHSRDRSALILNNHKILSFPRKGKKDSNTYELYDLNKDSSESTNLLKGNRSKNSGSKTSEALAEKMISLLKASNESIEKSMNGEDYPEKSVNEGQPKRQFWTEVDHYKKYFSQWKNRPEYKSRLRNIK